ncbi:MAG: hypothetical protein KKB31_01240 [Nanoarchaeota archaeon]|nr:hypothetical protein [Nanoarchaeota archaeon]
MTLGIEAIIYFLILVDAIGANAMAWCCSKWFKKNYKGFWKHFPTTKGWAGLYLVLVLWLGCALNRLGVI